MHLKLFDGEVRVILLVKHHGVEQVKAFKGHFNTLWEIEFGLQSISLAFVSISQLFTSALILWHSSSVFWRKTREHVVEYITQTEHVDFKAIRLIFLILSRCLVT